MGSLKFRYVTFKFQHNYLKISVLIKHIIAKTNVTSYRNCNKCWFSPSLIDSELHFRRGEKRFNLR